MNQIGHHRRQPIDLALRPAVFYRHVVAFNVTGFTQPFDKCGQGTRVTLARRETYKPYYRHRLLRTRRERPRNRCAADKRDELASFH
jgi:hypothetical protein